MTNLLEVNKLLKQFRLSPLPWEGYQARLDVSNFSSYEQLFKTLSTLNSKQQSKLKYIISSFIKGLDRRSAQDVFEYLFEPVKDVNLKLVELILSLFDTSKTSNSYMARINSAKQAVWVNIPNKLTSLDEVNKFLEDLGAPSLDCGTSNEVDLGNLRLTLKELSIVQIFINGLDLKQRNKVRFIIRTLLYDAPDPENIMRYLFNTLTDIEDGAIVKSKTGSAIIKSASTALWAATRATIKGHPFVIEVLLAGYNTATAGNKRILRFERISKKSLKVIWQN